jgi:hypothetical protein
VIVLRIAFQTLRARRTTLLGAFVAIWLAVTLAYATGLLMTGALSAPGPGRFAAADVVLRADPTIELGRDLDDPAIPNCNVELPLQTRSRIDDVAPHDEGVVCLRLCSRLLAHVVAPAR